MEEILAFALSVATGIFGSWLYDLIKRKPPNHNSKLPDGDKTDNHRDSGTDHRDSDSPDHEEV